MIFVASIGNKMPYMFDIETLGVESTAAILSFACTYFDPEQKPGLKQLRENTFFAKLNVTDQIKRLHRTTDKSTMEWWAKQCEIVRNRSFKPSPNDLKTEDALDLFAAWVKKYPPKQYVWARGNLDQCVFNSLEMSCNRTVLFPHYNWRDVRTAIDFLYNSNRGYVKVNHPEFDVDRDIYKHDPVDDCILDVMMLLYGSE